MTANARQNHALNRYLPGLLLGLLGFAGNWFRFPLFLNVDLLFGSICVMLALQFFGLGPGLLAALLAGSATLLIWNHPYALLIFVAELLVTGLLYQRWRSNLMLANTVYWLFVGMPLVLFFYGFVMKIGMDGTFAIMLKQAINGIANVIVASLIATWLLSRAAQYGIVVRPPSFRERITTLLALFVMVTALLLLVMSSRRGVARSEKQIVDLLSAVRRQAEGVLAADRGGRSSEASRQNLYVLIKAGAGLARVSYTLYSPSGQVIVADQTPAVQLPKSEGLLEPVTQQVSRWIPDLRHNISVMERWKRSVYLTTLQTPFGQLVIQMPVTHWIELMYINTTRILAATLLIFLFSLLPGIWISNRVCRSLQLLEKTTARLPHDIEAGKLPDWPQSSIPEVAQLADNLRQMTAALAKALEDKQIALHRLLLESDRREQLEELVEEQRGHERLRISRELHDDIGQALQAIKLNLQLQYAECAPQGCPGRELLGELIHDLEQTTINLRAVVSELRRSPAAPLLLADALQTMGDGLCGDQNIRFRARLDGTLEQLPEQVSTTLFFVAREGVVNAVRHAAPTLVELVLTVTPVRVCLIVRDDGSGGAAQGIQGSGIAIMKERTGLVGGSFLLNSSPGAGTTITVEVPLA